MAKFVSLFRRNNGSSSSLNQVLINGTNGSTSITGGTNLFHVNHHHHHSSSGDLKIGEPTNFKHNIQVKHDKERNQFIGLPDEWRSLLENNNIKFESANKQAAIEALNIYNKTVNAKNKTKKMIFAHRSDDFDSDDRIDLSGDELETSVLPSTNNTNNNLFNNTSSSSSNTPPERSTFITFNKQNSNSQLNMKTVTNENAVLSQRSLERKLSDVNIESF
jgi:hypothetical protein